MLCYKVTHIDTILEGKAYRYIVKSEADRSSVVRWIISIQCY